MLPHPFGRPSLWWCLRCCSLGSCRILPHWILGLAFLLLLYELHLAEKCFFEIYLDQDCKYIRNTTIVMLPWWSIKYECTLLLPEERATTFCPWCVLVSGRPRWITRAPVSLYRRQHIVDIYLDSSRSSILVLLPVVYRNKTKAVMYSILNIFRQSEIVVKIIYFTDVLSK